MKVNGIELEVGQVWVSAAGYPVLLEEELPGAGFTGRVQLPLIHVTILYMNNGTNSLQRHDLNLVALAKDNEHGKQADAPSAQAVVLDAPGYETLANVYGRAFNQAAVGKGAERHANGEPFDKQVMQDGAHRFGVGGLLFQAYKKSEESQRLPKDRAIAELLGAMNYLAGAVIAIERGAK